MNSDAFEKRRMKILRCAKEWKIKEYEGALLLKLMQSKQNCFPSSITTTEYLQIEATDCLKKCYNTEMILMRRVIGLLLKAGKEHSEDK